MDITHGPVVTPDAGPTRPMASQKLCGLREGPVWHYRQLVGGGSTPASGAFDVTSDTVFEVAVFPDLEHDPTSNASPPPNFDGCFAWFDFVTAEGTVRLVDQHDHPVDGSRGCLVADNWNLWQLDLSPLVGRRVERVDLASAPGRTGSGWLQVFGSVPRPTEAPDVVDRVRTTRGTHSAFLYSRGNALPLTCVPHGFNFLVPLTESRNRNWLYGYHRDGGPRPSLQALAFSHQPSPWIADRSAFQIMPWQGRAVVAPERRALAFTHDDEVDHPHHYSVVLDGGITAEMTPTSHGGVFRFTWRNPGRHGVILDQPYLGLTRCETLDDGRVAFHAAIAPQSGWTSGLRSPQPPAYVYGETRQPATIHPAWERRSPLEGLMVRGRRLHMSWFGKFAVPLPRPQASVLETGADVLEVEMAMSFISVDQARRSLRDEVGSAGFDEVANRAKAEWGDLLGRLEIDGGTLDQRVTAWSNLAALYSWPNAHHENVGTPESPRWAYASPFRKAGRHGLHTTGCQVVDGQLFVNNGYWDTFRTCWPAYSLLTPEKAPELLDGILQQYRDGGWMARWSAPGYVDCMVGTSSDAIFADASAQQTFADLGTELEAYDSVLRNALGPSDDPLTGRKSIGRARFMGYVDTHEPEGLSWTMDNASCDGAIALWSSRLAARAASDSEAVDALASRLDEFEANARWFANRSLSHALMFDPTVGFYQGRKPDGSFRASPADFDPTVWGPDYTETNAWGQAFHAPHDGAGLASLLGGEDALAAKLDEMLTVQAVTRPSMYGMHAYNTQEMNEAQAAGLGMLAMSNQPAHHIPYMYLFAGQPWKTQWLTREILDTLFTGSEIGQGYPGDEDNGQMSAWWLLTSMGLYPLFVGSGELVVTAPLFERLVWHRGAGNAIEVRASGVEHRYIQSLRVNGEPWHEVTIPVSVLHENVLLEFELGPEPSSWGAGSRPMSMGGGARAWQPDRTRDAQLAGSASLIDDRGRTVTRLAAGESVELSWDAPFSVSFLTLTSPDAAAPPLQVEVRREGAWEDSGLRTRASAQPDQTTAYALDGEIDGVRFTATADARVSQIEVY